MVNRVGSTVIEEDESLQVDTGQDEVEQGGSEKTKSDEGAYLSVDSNAGSELGENFGKKQFQVGNYWFNKSPTPLTL